MGRLPRAFNTENPMFRLLATTALVAAVSMAPALAQTTPPNGSPPPAAQTMKPKAAKPHKSASSGSSMAQKGSKAGDNSADELNRKELSQIQSR
jgi:hypothetical protein